jgi:D-amino-acid oxidase
MKRRVAVVGAGVVGLTVARLAQQRNCDVSIYSDKAFEASTSFKAPASFKPQAIDDESGDLVPWFHDIVVKSWSYYEQILARVPSSDSGVRKHLLWEAFSDERTKPYYWDIVEQFRVHRFPDVVGGYANGWSYQTFFVDMPVFLSWLHAQIIEAGGAFIACDTFTRLDQLADLPADIVFNCTGLGAKILCGDSGVVPIKGQIVVIDKLPDMDWSVAADGFYVYPRSNQTILGGTFEWDVDNDDVDSSAIDLIVRGNKRILPWLTLKAVRASYAGVRPYRHGGVRLESEHVQGKPIVHNYGHGGSGITLCWGCAHLALELAGIDE